MKNYKYYWVIYSEKSVRPLPDILSEDFAYDLEDLRQGLKETISAWERAGEPKGSIITCIYKLIDNDLLSKTLSD